MDTFAAQTIVGAVFFGLTTTGFPIIGLILSS